MTRDRVLLAVVIIALLSAGAVVAVDAGTASTPTDDAGGSEDVEVAGHADGGIVTPTAWVTVDGLTRLPA